MMKNETSLETGKWLKEIFRHCTSNGKYMRSDITVKEAAEIVSGIRLSEKKKSFALTPQPEIGEPDGYCQALIL
jgi:hypothetical protein